MSGRLTATRLSSAARDAVVIVGVFGLVGALAGVLWEAWWTPPVGVAYEGQFVMDSLALQSEFTGTGSYVVICAALGLLLGVVLTAVFDHNELVTLVAVVVGAVLAGWLMREIGAALGPPDPRPLAGSLDDYTELAADLRVQGSAWVALPAGALTGATVVLLGLTRGKV